MNKKSSILYGIGTMAIIAMCVWFYNGYIYPRLPESMEIPVSYMTGNYRELDSMAICNGDIDCIACFGYTLPQAYNIGYEMIMANRYGDANSHYYFLDDMLFLLSNEKVIYSFQQFNAKLEKMDDCLRVIALRHLAHCDRFHRQIGEDSIKIGKFAALYDSISYQEHKGMKGGDDE